MTRDELIDQIVKNSTKNYLICGAAGTGKSHLIKGLIERLEVKEGKKIVAVAHTREAAKIIKDAEHTVDKYFGFPSSQFLTKNYWQDRYHLNDKEKFENITTLIIDEISMVRVDRLYAISKILQMANNCREPFGNVRIILVGDLLQLSPILTDSVVYRNDDRLNELEGIKEWIKSNYGICKTNEVAEEFVKREYGGKEFWWFEDFWKLNFEIKKLTGSFRNFHDDDYNRILDEIRINRVDENILSNINAKVIPESYSRGKVYLVARKVEKTQITNQIYTSIKEDEMKFEHACEDLETFCQGWKKGDIDDNLPLPKEIRLKVGAQVMITETILSTLICCKHKFSPSSCQDKKCMPEIIIGANTIAEITCIDDTKKEVEVKIDGGFQLTKFDNDVTINRISYVSYVRPIWAEVFPFVTESNQRKDESIKQSYDRLNNTFDTMKLVMDKKENEIGYKKDFYEIANFSSHKISKYRFENAQRNQKLWFIGATSHCKVMHPPHKVPSGSTVQKIENGEDNNKETIIIVKGKEDSREHRIKIMGDNKKYKLGSTISQDIDCNDFQHNVCSLNPKEDCTFIKVEKDLIYVEQSGTEHIFPKRKQKFFTADKYSQIPLILLYAVTVHSIAGIELDKATIVHKRNWWDKMLYVALSRIRSLDEVEIMGIPVKSHEFRHNPELEKFERGYYQTKDGISELIETMCFDFNENFVREDAQKDKYYYFSKIVADANIISLIEEKANKDHSLYLGLRENPKSKKYNCDL